MEQQIIKYLTHQRNEALDTLAMVASERDFIAAERDALKEELNKIKNSKPVSRKIIKED